MLLHVSCYSCCGSPFLFQPSLCLLFPTKYLWFIQLPWTTAARPRAHMSAGAPSPNHTERMQEKEEWFRSGALLHLSSLRAAATPSASKCTTHPHPTHALSTGWPIPCPRALPLHAVGTPPPGSPSERALMYGSEGEKKERRRSHAQQRWQEHTHRRARTHAAPTEGQKTDSCFILEGTTGKTKKGKNTKRVFFWSPLISIPHPSHGAEYMRERSQRED